MQYRCSSLECTSGCHYSLHRVREDQPAQRILFDLSVVLNADVVGDAGMAEAEDFAFSVLNDLPLYFWLARMFFRKEQGRI